VWCVSKYYYGLPRNNQVNVGEGVTSIKIPDSLIMIQSGTLMNKRLEHNRYTSSFSQTKKWKMCLTLIKKSVNTTPTFALWSTALTKQRSWRCPTDRLWPPCPTWDPNPPNLLIAVVKWHRCSAPANSESRYSSRGSIFSLTVPQKRKGSWGIIAIRDLKQKT
jgi:hypothetical protein